MILSRIWKGKDALRYYLKCVKRWNKAQWLNLIRYGQLRKTSA
jgi:hypothetical protein